MSCNHDTRHFIKQKVDRYDQGVAIICDDCEVQGEMHIDGLLVWPEPIVTNQHHFEVVVEITGDKITGPYVNDEHSASWPEGTVYCVDDEEWLHYAKDGEEERSYQMLNALISLPYRLATMMDDNSDQGAWDGADICERLAEMLRQFNVQTKCPRCYLLHAVTMNKCWCEDER